MMPNELLSGWNMQLSELLLAVPIDALPLIFEVEVALAGGYLHTGLSKSRLSALKVSAAIAA